MFICRRLSIFPLVEKKKLYSCDPGSWVDLYSDEFFRFAMSRTKNREVAEDLVQDTFLAGLNALEGFRRDCSEKSWLYNILRNKIIDHFRKKVNSELKMTGTGYDNNEENFLQRYFDHNEHWKENIMPGSLEINAHSKLEQEEFMQFLMLCLSLLPLMWSKVFSLKNIEEYSSDEICKELDITPSNLWTIVHRSKLQLRECLEKRWIDK